MGDFSAKICAKNSHVEVEESHQSYAIVEDDTWWILQIGHSAVEDSAIIENFRIDPIRAPLSLRKDCAYIALRKKDQNLFVARDPFGFIPIRYARNNQTWHVWTGPKIPKTIHQKVHYERLCAFIAHRPDTEEEGYFTGVFRMLPGHLIHFSPTKISKHRYYKPESKYSTESISVLSKRFREALFSAIPDSQLLALSGGLDSSSLLCAMSDATTHTMFSSRFRSADERKEVALLCEYFRSENTLFDVADNKLWTSAKQFNDEKYQGYGPIFHPPVFGEQKFFASMLADNGGPILTGIGGDNALDVSPNQVARHLIKTRNFVALKSLWKKYPSVIRRQLYSTPISTLLPSGLQKNSIRKDFPWMNYPLKPAEPFSEHWGEARRDRVLSWSWEQVTRLLDSHGRAIGSAILSPWMSSPVWNILVRVPPQMLFYGNRHKGFLRHAMKGLLPEEIRNAGKSKHFGKPSEFQFLNYQKEILDLFSDSALHKINLIDAKKFEDFFAAQISDIEKNLHRDIPAPTMLTWPTIAAEIWLKENS